MGAVSDARAESFQEMSTMDKWYQGKLSSSMLAGYCW
jgi:hypothetical protein